MKQEQKTIHADVRIGHVHLKVADLERALKFYCGVLGFELQQRFGSQAAFVSAGDYHHHKAIGLRSHFFLGQQRLKFTQARLDLARFAHMMFHGIERF